MIERQPGHSLDDFAAMLVLPPEQLRRLVEDRHAVVDAFFLVDAIAAVVRQLAIDPKWLLTGSYDHEMHWRALQLGEDGSPEGLRAFRDFIDEQFRRFRFAALQLFSSPDSRHPPRLMG